MEIKQWKRKTNGDGVSEERENTVMRGLVLKMEKGERKRQVNLLGRREKRRSITWGGYWSGYV